MPLAARRAALEAGLAAYARDDWFLAHELLEPAWMGTRDRAERELLQGLIKLSAGFVHAARGNVLGVDKNLRGALERITAGSAAGAKLHVDVDALLRDLADRLADEIRLSDPPIAISRSGEERA
jgi:predicted metal-dependent hydrolase